jgi:exonuclease III
MNLVDSAKPDIIVGTESWLRPEIHNSEFTPPGYTFIARRDRQDGYDGVFIMAKSITPCDQRVIRTVKWTSLVVHKCNRSN